MKKLAFLLLIVVFSVSVSALSIESIVVGNDRSVQTFTKFDAIPFRVIVRSPFPIPRVSFCVCSIQNGECSREDSGMCGVLPQKSHQGTVQTYGGLIPPLEPGTYKVWVRAINAPDKVKRFWYSNAQNDASKGVIKISDRDALSFTSLRPLALVPLFGSTPVWRMSPQVAACFGTSEQPVVQGGRVVGKTLALLFKPRCDVCGDFELNVTDPANVLRDPATNQIISNQYYRLAVPCQADVLVVGRSGVTVPNEGSRGFVEYAKRIGNEGLTYKVAQVGKSGEVRLRTAGSGGSVFELAKIVAAKQGGLDPVSTAKALREIRGKVKPKYVLLLGGPQDIPFYTYLRASPSVHGFLEFNYSSDHAYMVETESANDPKVVVSVSRVPFHDSTELNSFFLNAATYRQISQKPATLTVYDPAYPLDKRTNQTIMPYYYGNSQCTLSSKCFYSPRVCMRNNGDVQFPCNQAEFRQFTASSRFHMYQVHGSPSLLLGPEKTPGSNDYYFLVAGNDFLSDPNMKGALVAFQSCRALNIQDPTTYTDGRIVRIPSTGKPIDFLSTAALKAGAVGVIGKVGKTNAIELPGVPGRTVRMGDELVRLKRTLSGEQQRKLAYYGDPLLKVKIS